MIPQLAFGLLLVFLVMIFKCVTITLKSKFSKLKLVRNMLLILVYGLLFSFGFMLAVFNDKSITTEADMNSIILNMSFLYMTLSILGAGNILRNTKYRFL